MNGPYALITTSVSAELGMMCGISSIEYLILNLTTFAGQHSSLNGNGKALATVTAIIDGTGSIGTDSFILHLFIYLTTILNSLKGAAVGPLVAGLVSSSGWQNVFYMLIASDILALLLLLRPVSKELKRRSRRRNVRIE